MAYTVYPSANNIGGGRIIREKYLTAVFDALIYPGAGFVDTGFSLVNGGGLNVYVGAGRAVVDGYIITNDANWLIPGLTATGTYYVALGLTFDSSSYVTDAVLYARTTNSLPASNIRLFKVTMSGGQLYMYQNFRPTIVGMVTQPVW